MQTHTTEARIQTTLGGIHRMLWRAALDAETLRDQGLADDLHMLRGEVERLLKAQTGRRRPIRGQLEFPGGRA